MSYILLLVFSVYPLIPSNISLSEFQTKEACEAALDIAKGYFKTVDRDSKCISVRDIVEKKKLEEKLKNIKRELKND